MISDLKSFINSRDALYFCIYSTLIVCLYCSTLSFLFYQLKIWEAYNYGYIIPLVVLYMIWEKRNQLIATRGTFSNSGLMFATAGLGMFWIGELGGELFMQYISLWMVISGLILMHLGWTKLKLIWFPILFLMAMFPPPNFINFPLNLKLKLISSQIGVWMMQAFGLSAYREGNVIDLGFTQLQVVDACSGLRYLFPLLLTGVLLAYWFRSSLWKKIILVLSAIPLTIITNSLRITLTGIFYKAWGPEVSEGFFHGFSGWFIFMFGLGVMLVELWILGLGNLGIRGLGRKKLRDSGIQGFRDCELNDSYNTTETTDSTDSTNPINSTDSTFSKKKIYPVKFPPGRSGADFNGTNKIYPMKFMSTMKGSAYFTGTFKSFFSPPQFIVAVLLLGATLAVSQLVEFREKIPMSRSFAEFPMQMGEWSGRRGVMEPRLINTLDLSDYVIVDYVDSSGRGVNFYTAYYESQRKGESIHSPETCLPGGGWEIKKNSLKTVPLEHHNPVNIRVNRAVMQKNDVKQLTYFWFPARGRILTNAYQLKLYTFWDALTRQRTDGALVRLVTPVYRDERLADADARLIAFTREIVPVLDGYLPK